MITTTRAKIRVKWNRITRTAVLLLGAILIHGCSIADRTPPEALLDRALNGMAGKDQFRFQGMAEIRTGRDKLLAKQLRYEGEIQQHKGIYMRLSPQAEQTTTENRWNPLKQLEELRIDGAKRVKALTSYDPVVQTHAGSTSKMHIMSMDEKQRADLIPLQVDVDAEQAKHMYTKQLIDDYDRLITPNVQLQQMKGSMSQADEQKLQKKLSALAAQGRKDLYAKLKNAAVQAKYVVWVNKRDSLPAYVEGWITSSYDEQGEPKEELVHMQSRFLYK